MRRFRCSCEQANHVAAACVALGRCRERLPPGAAAVWVAAALMLAILVLIAAIAAHAADLRAGELTVCRAAKGSNKDYWAWREIGGRKCWFRGHRSKPKSELVWEQPRLEAAKPEGGEADDGTGGRRTGPGGPHNAPPLPPPRPREEARALTADDLLANTCCWPQLEIDDQRKAATAPIAIAVPHFPAQPAPHWTWLVLLAPAGYISWVMLKELASK